MRAELVIQLLKFCFQIFNCIFLVLGVGVLSCSLWILFSSGNLLGVLHSDEVRIVGVGLLVIGGVVLLVSVLGCIGAHREKVLLLMMYLGLLIVLVLGQLFVMLLLLINRDKIEGSLDETLDQLIRQYSPDRTSQNQLLDSLQKHSATLLWCSARVKDVLIGQGDVLYEQGCTTKVSEWLQQNVLTIVVMDFGLILIQVIQSFIAIYLWRVIGRRVALTGSSVLEVSDHTPLDPIPHETYGGQNEEQEWSNRSSKEHSPARRSP